MFNPFMELDKLTVKQLNEKILDIKAKITRAKNAGLNSMLIEAMQIQVETVYEELYNRQEMRIHKKEQEESKSSCVFDTEEYIRKNKEKQEGSNESTRKQNYKPGW